MLLVRLAQLLTFILPPRFCLQIHTWALKLLRLKTVLVTFFSVNFVGVEMQSHKFPDTLAGFGYGFNKEGQMRRIDKESGEISDKPFEFEAKPGDHSYNQAHYEALGEIITQEIYNLLESETNLKCIKVTSSEILKFKKLPKNVPSSFIFSSSDAMTNPEKLVVLIHGAGVVRAGQWARRLIINEDLQKGTQIPFIKWALKEGYGVMVLNTNHNTDIMNQQEVDIPGSESPENHARTVWDQFIGPSKAKNIFIIAHSYGGLVTMDLVSRFKEDFMSRVRSVLLTDSVHGGLPRDKDVRSKLKEIAINYVSSDKPLGSRVNSFGDIPCVSAGHPKHEWTSYSAMEAIFQEIKAVEEAAQIEEEAKKEDGDDKDSKDKDSKAKEGAVDKDDKVKEDVVGNEKKRNLSGESSIKQDKGKLEKKEL